MPSLYLLILFIIIVPVSKLSVTEQLGLGMKPSVTWNLNAVEPPPPMFPGTFICYFIAHNLFLLWFPFPVPEKVPEIKSNTLLGGATARPQVKFESVTQSSAELLLGSG